MKTVSFGSPGSEKLGVLVDQEIFSATLLVEPTAESPKEDRAFFAGLCDSNTRERWSRQFMQGEGIPVDSVRIGPPSPHPQKIIAVAGNSRSHLAEAQEVTGWRDPLPSPLYHAKPSSSLVGPADDIVIHNIDDNVDYEGELAVIIGREGRNISTASVGSHIAGYTVANDVTARSIALGKKGTPPSAWQLYLGKGYDTFCPSGPWLVTPDEFGDVDSATLACAVDGELRQFARLGDDFVFSIGEIVHRLSTVMTLFPGDVVLTGCPAGVGLFQSPPVYLQPGNVVTVSIDRIGEIRNEVVGSSSEDSSGHQAMREESR